MEPIELSYVYPGNAISARSASGLGNYDSVNASAILQLSERHTLQVLATVTSSISLLAALCASFWFVMMQRNFRRDLVLLLILGGSWKSFWFMTFSAVTFARGPIKTSSAFCQAGGYCLQVGFEACDVAVFFMSMHMYYQIFPPSHSLLGHDGLYRVRTWVYAIWIIFPNLSAGLAFINPRAAFMAQGAFCSIPLRPFWYRLGLFWIPRYLIWLYIVFVAVRIYRHVGSEFKVFGEEKASAASLDMPGQSSIDRAKKADLEQNDARRLSKASNTGGSAPSDDSLEPRCAPDNVGGAYLINPVAVSNLDWTVQHATSDGRHLPLQNISIGPQANTNSAPLTNATATKSGLGAVQSGSDTVCSDTVDSHASHRQGSMASFVSRRSSTQHSADAVPALVPIGNPGDNSLPSTIPRATASQAMEKRRQAIQRQLRLLFIYPVVYMLLWTIPFVVNIMNFTDYFAQNPVYALQILQIFMLTIMTHVDVVVFCWRERPWRHIPGSDGTVLGSFFWWRYCFERAWVEGRRASRAPSTVPRDVGGVEAEKAPSSPPATPSSRRGVLASLCLSLRRGSCGGGGAAAAAPRPSSWRPDGFAAWSAAVPQKRNFSGGSDREQLEAQRARERLAMERAEFERHRRSWQEARASVVSNSEQAVEERKEWFDRLDSDLFLDNVPGEQVGRSIPRL